MPAGEVSIRPDPDPTVRTTEGIAAAVESLKSVMQERFTAYDKAIELLQRKSDKEPQISQVADSVTYLKELMQTQLKERDIRSEQTKKDGEVAIAAALQAQKEAVGKTELGFTKELDAMKENTKTETNGLRAQIEDLKKAPMAMILILIGLAVNAVAIWFHH